MAVLQALAVGHHAVVRTSKRAEGASGKASCNPSAPCSSKLSSAEPRLLDSAATSCTRCKRPLRQCMMRWLQEDYGPEQGVYQPAG